MQTTEHMNRPMPFPQNGKLDMSQVVLLSDTVGNGLIGLLGGVGTGGGFVPTGGAFATIREEDEDGDPGIGDMTIGGSSGSGNRTKNGVSVDDADEDPDIGDAGIFPATKAEIAEAREKALETNVRMFEPISGEKIAAAPDTQGLNQTKGNGSDAGGGTVGEKNGVSQNRQSTSSGPGPALPDPNAESRSSTKSGSFSPPKAPAGVRPPSLSARPSSSSSPDGDSRRSSKRAPPFALDMRNVESGVDPRLKFLETLVGLVVRPHCKDLSTEDHKYPSSVIEPHTGKVRQFFSAFVDGSITRELPMSFEGEQFSWHRLSELRSSYLNKTVVVQDPRRDRNAAPDLSRRLDGDIGEILSGDSLKMVCWATDIRDREHKDDEVRQEIDTLLQDYQTLKNSLARNRADEIAAYYGYEFHPSYNCLYLYSEYIDGGTVWDRIALKRLSRRHEIMRAEIGISRDNIDPGILGLAEKEVQFITTRVVKGLEQLHYLGVFHGALRCSNIGINRRSGKVQLLDWGVSKLRTYCNDAAMSYTAWNCRWMAPELLNEGSGAPGAAFNISAMSKKSDLWSLGCCVLEMLMGAAPYSSVASVARATPQQTLYWLRSGEHVPPAPEKFTTAECRDFCQMCLVWDVENRVETGSDRFVCHPFRKPSFQARYEAPKPGSTSGTSAQSGTTQANNASNFQQQQQETGKSASAGGSKSSASPGAGPDSPAYNSRQFVTVRGSALPMDPREFFERQRQRGVKLPPTEKFDGAAPAKVAPDGKADAKPKKPRPPGAQLDPGMPRPTSFHNLRNNPRVAHRAGNSPSPPPLARVVA
ncbi:unnamed protein product [Amoebophrya sp. A25]|nr:unnamed protein product [Amoebophrya sp. A25]|eukprot:GSA25T00015287001.1